MLLKSIYNQKSVLQNFSLFYSTFQLTSAEVSRKISYESTDKFLNQKLCKTQKQCDLILDLVFKYWFCTTKRWYLVPSHDQMAEFTHYVYKLGQSKHNTYLPTQVHNICHSRLFHSHENDFTMFTTFFVAQVVKYIT